MMDKEDITHWIVKGSSLGNIVFKSLRLEYAVMQSHSLTLARHKQQIDFHHPDKRSLSSNAAWPHSMYTKVYKQTQVSSGNRHCC